jgi:hypothetical protein
MEVFAMKIYFFEVDPETKFIRVGFTHNGKRYIGLVQSQCEENYVTTGSKVTNDFERHNFTEAQKNALSAFLTSSLYSIEYTQSIQ